MNAHFKLILGILTMVMSSCQSGPNLKDYYFPVNSLQEGLVYEYSAAGDSEQPPHSWFYKSHTENGNQFLSGQYYNASGAVEQFTLEEITAARTLAREYRLISYDSTGRMKTADLKLIKNQIYPFGKPNTKTIERFKISWSDPIETQYTNELNRGRVFKQFTPCSYQGKEVDCAEFVMVENIEVEKKNDGVQTLETTTKELYAKGIGLVYYQKKIGDNTAYTYELTDRISMIDFAKRYKDAFEKEY